MIERYCSRDYSEEWLPDCSLVFRVGYWLGGLVVWGVAGIEH